MKVMFVAAGMMLAVSSYAAPKYTLYLVEPMVCKGAIQEKPEGMAKGYEHVKLTFTSFFSVRKDKTKANSLETEVTYSEDGKDWGDNLNVWYGGPLRHRELRDGTEEVYRPELSGREDALELEVTETKEEGRVRRDKLEGTWTLGGTVVGNYAYDLECRATVVKKPSKTLDYTAEK